MTQAFIFGAGYGVRLLPITASLPKVVVPVLNKPVIFYTIEKLVSLGFNQIVINTHYLPDKLKEIVGNGNRWGINITYSDETAILETGGGLKFAEHLMPSQTFIVHNGDIICDVDLIKAIEFHKEKKALATLVVSSLYEPKQVSLNADGKIIDIRKTFKKEISPTHTFLGIHIIEREIFNELEYGKKFSIIQSYLNMISQGKPVYAFDTEQSFWCDIGSIEHYKKAHLDLLGVDGISGNGGLFVNKPLSSFISEKSNLNGYVSVGERCVIKEGVVLRNVILWDDVVVKPGSVLLDTIVRNGVTVCGKYENAVL